MSWFDDSRRIHHLECDTTPIPVDGMSMDDWKTRVSVNAELLQSFQEETLKFLNTEFLRKIIRTSAVDHDAYKQAFNAYVVAAASSSPIKK
jgi:hypothetical protein